jgi:hypothetical protein
MLLVRLGDVMMVVMMTLAVLMAVMPPAMAMVVMMVMMAIPSGCRQHRPAESEARQTASSDCRHYSFPNRHGCLLLLQFFEGHISGFECNGDVSFL